MAKLATAMYKHFPQYYILFSQKTFSYNGRTMYTHNHVLKKFKGADGMKTGYTRAAGFNIVTSAKRQGNRVIAVTMGHKTLNARDNQVISMMSRGLTKLAQNDRDRTARMYAKLKPIVPIPAVKPKHLAQNQETAQTWGIQLGAFSNYTKARNYALKIKNSTQPYLKGKDISIEPIATGAAVVYRTKIVGLARNDADTACKKIKSKNKTCIAANPTKHYASARRY